MSLGLVRRGDRSDRRPPDPPDVPAPSPAAVRTGRLVVIGVVLAAVVGTLAILRDAGTASPVIAVPSASGVVRRPADAAQAAQAVWSFVPSGGAVSVAQAIAAATGSVVPRPGHVAVARAGRSWQVDISVPVQTSHLLRTGAIFTSGGQGSSDLGRGLVDVTAGTTEYVLRMNATSHIALFRFRLSADATTLSAMNWNANSIVSQTSVGNGDIP